MIMVKIDPGPGSAPPAGTVRRLPGYPSKPTAGQLRNCPARAALTLAAVQPESEAHWQNNVTCCGRSSGSSEARQNLAAATLRLRVGPGVAQAEAATAARPAGLARPTRRVGLGLGASELA